MPLGQSYGLGVVVRLTNGVLIYLVEGKVLSSSAPLSHEQLTHIEYTMAVVGWEWGRLTTADLQNALKFSYDEDDEGESLGSVDTWSNESD